MKRKMQTSDSLTSPSSSYGTQVIIMTCGTHLICYWIKWSICFLPLGDVFIIYCKDRGSQTLPPNQLYNTRLHSIDQHATLVKLKKKNRVFSVYECLHLQQVELLGDCVEQLWFWYMWVFLFWPMSKYCWCSISFCGLFEYDLFEIFSAILLVFFSSR